MSLIFRVSLLINLTRKVSRQPKDGAKASTLGRPRNSFNLINIALFNIFLFGTCTQAWTANVCEYQNKSKIICKGDIDIDRNIIYKNYDGLSLESTGLIITPSSDTKIDPQGIKISTGSGTKSPSFTGDMSLTWHSGKIHTSGKSIADGIRVENWGQGATSLIFEDGHITTEGRRSHGMSGQQKGRNPHNSANVDVDFSGLDSTITTHGDYSEGIVGGTKSGIGRTLVSAREGKVTTTGASSIAVRGFNMGGLYKRSTGNVEVTASKLTVTTEGQDSHGIAAQNKSLGTSTVKISGGKISTSGFKSHGVLARNDNNGIPRIIKNITINSELMRTFVHQYDGEIATSGDQAHGIAAISPHIIYNAEGVINQHAGEVKTQGDNAFGLSALIVKGSLKIIQGESAKVTATGLGSDGISAIGNKSVDIKIAGKTTGGRSQIKRNIRPSDPAPVQYSPDSRSAEPPPEMGDGVGIYAAARNWQLSVLSPDNRFYPIKIEPNGNPKRIWTSTKFTNDLQVSIDIQANGEINALSDKAIKTDGGTAEITNEGTIIGTVSTWNQNDIFTNNAKWEIRNFQVSPDATNPVAIKRNTEDIAVADFGEGYDQFINSESARVELKTVGNQSDGFIRYYPNSNISEYRPNEVNLNSKSITAAGVEQAHIVNLERFENAGTITMADKDTGGTDPVAGDVLVITSSKSANEPAGTSQFVSNGGELHIDTLLNDGQHDLTDLLVVDTVEPATEATSVIVNNTNPYKAASTDINCNGLPDPDEGILIIYVRGGINRLVNYKKTFVLKNKLIAGDWEYRLHQSDGKSWFLHSIPMKPKGVVHLTNPNYINDGNNGISSDLSTVPDDKCQALKPVSYSYSLVSGEGDTDNDKVTVDGNKIIISGIFLEYTDKEFLSIRVQSKLNDYGFSQAITIDLRNYLPTSEESDSKPEEPIEEELVDEKTLADEPIVEEPVADESIVEEPVADGPVAEEPIVEEPVADETATEGPVAEDSIEEKPVADESIVEEPVADKPVAEEPVVEEPVADEPIVEEPVADGPVAEEPIVEEPVADETAAEGPVAEDSSIEEKPVADEPIVEEPVVDETVAEEPIVEEPVANGPVAEEPIVEEPVADESVTEEPAAEEPVAEESPEEESVTEEPVVEEAVSKGSNSVETFSEAESGCCINNQVSPIINPIIDNNAISYIVERDGAQDTVFEDINTVVSNNKETNTLEYSSLDETDRTIIQATNNNGVSSPSAVETPITDISLNSNTIDEDKVRGTIIGDLSAVMTGDNQNVSYHLVPGAGDTDNNKISISGNQLISTDVFDFERNSTLSIRVQAEISNRPLFEKALTIAITDTEADGCINHQIASNNQYSPLPFISSAHASNGSSVVSNTSTIMWLLYFFALRFLHKSKKINERWKYLFIVGLTIPLVACGGAGAQSIGQC